MAMAMASYCSRNDVLSDSAARLICCMNSGEDHFSKHRALVMMPILFQKYPHFQQLHIYCTWVSFMQLFLSFSPQLSFEELTCALLIDALNSSNIFALTQICAKEEPPIPTLLMDPNGGARKES
jgi:hypothetical protein